MRTRRAARNMKVTTQDECPEIDEDTATSDEAESMRRYSEVSPGKAAFFD
jgi:hypothetical protein